MPAGAYDFNEVFARGVALDWHLNGFAARQILSCQRIGRLQNIGASALRHDAATVHASTGPHVNHMVGNANHVFVVLHHQHAVADVAQMLEGANEAVVVALMQTNARLVEHIHHTREARANLAGQSNALRFTTRQGIGTAVEAQIVQTHVVQELQA